MHQAGDAVQAMDWDDLRVFVTLARTGSVWRAARELRVNHSTVSRRIAQFEEKLGVRVFERLPRGYELTADGERVLASALRVQEEIDTLERQVLGQDARLAGAICFTMPDHFVSFLTPALTEFEDRYPDIELEVRVSFSQLSLSQREADVALRVTQESPPEGLVGRRVTRHSSAAYASRDYLARHDLAADPPTARWIGWDDLVPFPKWVKESDYPHIPVRGRLNHPMLQLEAVRAGFGLALAPCFIGDADPLLERVPPGRVFHNRDVWLLTHRDLRAAARIRAFLDFLADVFRRERPLFEGERPRTASAA